MAELTHIKVWDPLVRFFHWSLASSFIIAYITSENLITVHSWAGYLIISLLLIRTLWGFIGSHYARFADFIYSPATIKQFFQETIHLKAKRYIGHNPAGGAMIIALMLSLFLTTATGMLLLGSDEHSGPFASLFLETSKEWSDIFEETHEFFANLTILLIIGHLFGVLIESFIHKENLALSMITGFKPKRTRDRQ